MTYLRGCEGWLSLQLWSSVCEEPSSDLVGALTNNVSSFALQFFRSLDSKGLNTTSSPPVQILNPSLLTTPLIPFRMLTAVHCAWTCTQYSLLGVGYVQTQHG